MAYLLRSIPREQEIEDWFDDDFALMLPVVGEPQRLQPGDALFIVHDDRIKGVGIVRKISQNRRKRLAFLQQGEPRDPGRVLPPLRRPPRTAAPAHSVPELRRIPVWASTPSSRLDPHLESRRSRPQSTAKRFRLLEQGDTRIGRAVLRRSEARAGYRHGQTSLETNNGKA